MKTALTICSGLQSLPGLRRLPSKAVAAMLSLALFGPVVPAVAQVPLYEDYFNREEIGPDWTVFIDAAPTPYILYPYERYVFVPDAYTRVLSGYTGVELPEQFGVTLFAQIHISLAGVAFNIQDEGNFYAARAWYDSTEQNTLFQLIKTVDGVDYGLHAIRVDAIDLDTQYRFSVISDGNGEIGFSLETIGGEVLGSAFYHDTDNPFTGGYGGILLDGNFLSASYFAVVPEPASVGLLLSAAGVLGMGFFRSRKPTV